MSALFYKCCTAPGTTDFHPPFATGNADFLPAVWAFIDVVCSALHHQIFLAVKEIAQLSGLVQIPCIERNAHAAARAFDANIYSSFSDGLHSVSFDKVVAVMKQTGYDLPSVYKETSEGGLAKYYR